MLVFHDLDCFCFTHDLRSRAAGKLLFGSLTRDLILDFGELLLVFRKLGDHMGVLKSLLGHVERAQDTVPHFI